MSKRDLIARLLCTEHGPRIRFLLHSWRGWVVLAYHRIGRKGDSPTDPALFSATPEEFAWQVAFVARHFPPATPEDLLAPTPRRRAGVIFTFDDGYRDNATVAAPVLSANGLSGLFFLATGFIDQPRLPWWDRLAVMLHRAPSAELPLDRWGGECTSVDQVGFEAALQAALRVYKRLPGTDTGGYLAAIAQSTGGIPPELEQQLAGNLWMTWDAVRTMRDAGMIIGGHTVTHPILANLPLSRQREEINGCVERIGAELGQRPRFFAYPVGGPTAFSADTSRLVSEAGLRMAFSYYGGWNALRIASPYNVRRQSVEMSDGHRLFGARLSAPRIMIGAPS